MLRRIEPERIICYNEPFPEMQGNIVYVDYELSSWKYHNDDYAPSKYAKYILGLEPIPKDSNIVLKQGFVLPHNLSLKGMGKCIWRKVETQQA